SSFSMLMNPEIATQELKEFLTHLEVQSSNMLANVSKPQIQQKTHDYGIVDLKELVNDTQPVIDLLTKARSLYNGIDPLTDEEMVQIFNHTQIPSILAIF
ncbi:5764_t:CDS:2, partial [Entrophospora sp. SA101]